MCLAVSPLVACGSPSTSGGANGTKGQDAAIRAVMSQWAVAASASAQCDLVSSGFRYFIGNGDPSHTACVKRADPVLGPPSPGTLRIHSLHDDHGQTLVDATVGEGRSTYYFVPEYGTWKINSVALREGLGPPAPSKGVYDG